MNSSDSATYGLSVYSTEFAWDGELVISAHRRLSDFINDNASAFLVLNRVVPAIWENNSFHKSHEIDSIALVKENVVAVIVNADSVASSRMLSVERVPKVPLRVFVYAPPLFLQGDLHIPHQANWIDAVSVPHRDFFPITNANVWSLKNCAPLGTNLNLALIHRRRMIGIESKVSNAPLSKQVVYPITTRIANTFVS